MPITLCHIDDIAESQAKDFTLPQTKVFAVKKQGEIYVYINRCPHLGVPLNWQPNKMLDPEGAYIQCSSHGALFTIDNGECIYGPCQGQALWQLDYTLSDGQVLISEEDLPEPPRLR